VGKERSRLVYLKCMGHIQGGKWLAVQNGDVCLIETQDVPTARWLITDVGNNSQGIKCAGLGADDLRWLKGTQDGVVLTDKSEVLQTESAKWRIQPYEAGLDCIECLGLGSQRRWLDGNTRTLKVYLTSQASKDNSSGTRWRVISAEGKDTEDVEFQTMADSYKSISVLGEGGAGRVHKVEDEQGQVCAL